MRQRRIPSRDVLLDTLQNNQISAQRKSLHLKRQTSRRGCAHASRAGCRSQDASAANSALALQLADFAAPEAWQSVHIRSFCPTRWIAGESPRLKKTRSFFFSAGPEVQYFCEPASLFLQLRYQFEFDARDRFEGRNMVFSFVKVLGSNTKCRCHHRR